MHLDSAKLQRELFEARAEIKKLHYVDIQRLKAENDGLRKQVSPFVAAISTQLRARAQARSPAWNGGHEERRYDGDSGRPG